MLSQKDLSILYQIISNDKQTFKNVSESFNNNFKKEMKSKVCTTLIFLLRDNLLNIHQRIISYYIIYEISKKEKLGTNPYIPIILEMIQKTQNKNEQIFLEDFLYNRINYFDITIEHFLNDNTKDLKLNLKQLKMQCDKYYKEILINNNINLKSNDEIRPIIYDRKKSDIKNIDNHNNLNLFKKDNELDKEFNFNYFNPNYFSYCPVNNNFLNAEPIWLLPQLNHNFLWEKKNDKK